MPRWDQTIGRVVEGRDRYALARGDCLEVARALPPAIFDSCIIDPPYGMHYQGWKDKRPAIANDERPFIWWLHDAFRLIKPGGALACFCQRHGMGHPACTFAPQHDVVWFATKGSGFQFPAGRPPSVLRFANVPATQRLHSTQKPDALMRELVRRLTPAGGIVYDPCMGSGSTGAAAVAAGYRFVGVELDEGNFKTAQQRLRDASRIKAKPAAPIHYTPARRAVA